MYIEFLDKFFIVHRTVVHLPVIKLDFLYLPHSFFFALVPFLNGNGFLSPQDVCRITISYLYHSSSSCSLLHYCYHLFRYSGIVNPNHCETICTSEKDGSCQPHQFHVSRSSQEKSNEVCVYTFVPLSTIATLLTHLFHMHATDYIYIY